MPFSLNHLTDIEFEEFCFDLLIALGFVNVSWRKGAGLDTATADRGRDIQCERIYKDGIDNSVEVETWFVQCKHHLRRVPPEKLLSAWRGHPQRCPISSW